MHADLPDFAPEYLLELAVQGYAKVRVCGPAGICAVKRYNYTYGLVVDLQPLGHGRRYCFELASEAEDALASWDGNAHPTGPWIKCKGANIDLLNPAFGVEQREA